MRLVTTLERGAATAAVLLGTELVSTTELGAPASVRELLAEFDSDGLHDLGQRAERSGAPRRTVAEASLAAPVPDPEKIICIGLNYRDHAEETGQEIPQAPMWFAKFRNSLCGSGADIVLPGAHPDYVDYEAELALVIGRTARNVAERDALSHVAGAMPFNDVSARDLQTQNPLWTSGKAIDTFAPCGPALVSLDELGDVQSLGIVARVNGQTVQSGNTSNMIFGIAETIAFLSRLMTFVPGDVIATGTPAGVGMGRRPPLTLQPGDEVEVDIEQVGRLRNRVTTEVNAGRELLEEAS
jgi:2-keto-4-pentenoate hydratase/2-oxohepta-3-ene-1,7-dioic acid hydratase in catechol pathway